ncbi:MAG: hypothetical protein ACPL4I_06275 [Bacteroidota bacterium]
MAPSAPLLAMTLAGCVIADPPVADRRECHPESFDALTTSSVEGNVTLSPSGGSGSKRDTASSRVQLHISVSGFTFSRK